MSFLMVNLYYANIISTMEKHNIVNSLQIKKNLLFSMIGRAIPSLLWCEKYLKIHVDIHRRPKRFFS